MVEKLFITYSEYSRMMDRLVYLIKTSNFIKDVKYLFTYPRGGWPIITHLSHHLNIDVLEIEPDWSTIPYKTVLFVDDVVDTGKTLERFHILFPTAALFYKPRSSFKPTVYVKETTDWIIYPWELRDEIPNR